MEQFEKLFNKKNQVKLFRKVNKYQPSHSLHFDIKLDNYFTKVFFDKKCEVLKSFPNSKINK